MPFRAPNPTKLHHNTMVSQNHVPNGALSTTTTYKLQLLTWTYHGEVKHNDTPTSKRAVGIIIDRVL